MTTIAWDGITLAADRAAWSGYHCYAVRKVYRVQRDGMVFLVGFAGDGGFAHQILAWMRGEGEMPGQYPDDSKTSLSVAIVVDQKRRVWKLNSYLYYTRCYGRLHVTGGGQDFAMGAMLAGASAKRAIQLTARHSSLAALGVDEVTF